jgi:hypothetical protein
MAKHLRVKVTGHDNIRTVIRIKAPDNDGPIQAKVTVACPLNSVPDLTLGLKAALVALETYALNELTGPVSLAVH